MKKKPASRSQQRATKQAPTKGPARRVNKKSELQTPKAYLKVAQHTTTPKPEAPAKKARIGARQAAVKKPAVVTEVATPAPRKKKVTASQRVPAIKAKAPTLPAASKLAREKKVPAPPAPKAAQAHGPLGELPDAYGTGRLFLTARDPRCLFAYWDWTPAQWAQHLALAHDHKVFLRLFAENGSQRQQLHIHPGARSWYLQVDEPDAVFSAQLGVYGKDQRWQAISTSGQTRTPRNYPSWRRDVQFVTLPFDWPFSRLQELVVTHLHPGEALAAGIARLQAEGFSFPFPIERRKTPHVQGDAAAFVQDSGVRRQDGSVDWAEWVRQRLEDSTSSGQWKGAPPDFYLHVNAEVIIYGGTRPGSRVRIDGQEIPLTDAGEFYYHFTFPDGSFHIPIDAASADGAQTRSALLSFLRMTATSGGVDATPPPPRPEPPGREPAT